ncbi:hypothetical protein T07_5911 [Trichinella nelsoni]|uniref:Uncharacterized protein n=1 Tax=Trichinella nelsoni TaxID=6336 RepID=A0A0V0RFP1_9BILA|nr:hypothetical protein T07_5911 [Trichinella nelsoni]
MDSHRFKRSCAMFSKRSRTPTEVSLDGRMETCVTSEATPTGELGGQEKPDWLGGQQPDERGSDEEVSHEKV